MTSFKGRHFSQDMILQSVQWYLTYLLSYRDIEEIMQGRNFGTRGARSLYLCVYSSLYGRKLTPRAFSNEYDVSKRRISMDHRTIRKT